MQNLPGASHFEIAMSVENLDPTTDVYQQMLNLRYIRIAEDFSTDHLHIDAPVPTVYQLTNGQRRWVKTMQSDGWKVVFNHKAFVESRDKLNTCVKRRLVASPACS